MEYLDAAFHAASYDVIGVQESSIQGNVTRDMTHYTVTTSGALTDGFFGVESWIRKDLPQGARVRPRACGPRLLCVAIGYPKLSFVHLVAHAPVDSAPADERDSFWNALRAEIQLVGSRKLVLLCIAGNATMGSTRSCSIPVVHDVPENANGYHLRTLLEEF